LCLESGAAGFAMSDPLRTVCVAGTRPEVIKLAPLCRALGAWPAAFRPELWIVAQQATLLQGALEEAALTPTLRLPWERGEVSLAESLAEIVERLSPLLERRRPELVIVQGDTTTTLAAALAARYVGIPLAHVEAGIRCTESPGPIPEEFHRRMLADLATYHYAPTARARENLLREGISAAAIQTVGNTGIDALFQTIRHAPLSPSGDDAKRRVLVTMHRRESFGAPMRSVCRALRELVGGRPDVEVDWILHCHPEARRTPLAELAQVPRVRLVEACPRREFLERLATCGFVITDSGGVQEEAPYLGTPALVARAATDRPEAIEAGVARLVGVDATTIVKVATELLDEPESLRAMARRAELFGDGRASERIRAHLADRFVRPFGFGAAASARTPAHCLMAPIGGVRDVPDAGRMLDWLTTAPVLREDGSVLSWVNDTHPGYAYPEAAALLLTTLVNEGATPALRRQIGDRLVKEGGDEGAIGRDGIAYAFDTAMALSAWATERAAGRDGAYTRALSRGLAFLEGCLDAHRAATPGVGLAPDRWSSSFGAHLLKTLHGLRAASVALGKPRGGQRAFALEAALGDLEHAGRFRIHAGSRWSYVHAHCYALEGLLALRDESAASARRLEEGSVWLATLQTPDGGIPAWHDGSTARGECHADATAQAIRLWAVLDRSGFAEPIARGLGFLARLQTPEGGIRYRPGSGDANTWCTCFALQAVRWVHGERLGDVLV